MPTSLNNTSNPSSEVNLQAQQTQSSLAFRELEEKLKTAIDKDSTICERFKTIDRNYQDAAKAINKYGKDHSHKLNLVKSWLEVDGRIHYDAIWMALSLEIGNEQMLDFYKHCLDLYKTEPRSDINLIQEFKSPFRQALFKHWIEIGERSAQDLNLITKDDGIPKEGDIKSELLNKKQELVQHWLQMEYTTPRMLAKYLQNHCVFERQDERAKNITKYALKNKVTKADEALKLTKIPKI